MGSAINKIESFIVIKSFLSRILFVIRENNFLDLCPVT